MHQENSITNNPQIAASLEDCDDDLVAIQSQDSLIRPRFVLVGPNKIAVQKKWQEIYPSQAQIDSHLAQQGNLLAIEPASLGGTVIDIDSDDADTVNQIDSLIVQHLGEPAFRVESRTAPHRHLFYQRLLSCNKRKFAFMGNHEGEIICSRSYLIMYHRAAWIRFIKELMSKPVPSLPKETFDFLPAPMAINKQTGIPTFRKYPSISSPAEIEWREHDRNNQLYYYAQQLSGQSEAIEELQAEAVNAGLSQQEVIRTVQSAQGSDVGKACAAAAHTFHAEVPHTPHNYAKRVVADMHEVIRYHVEAKEWLIWTGDTWLLSLKNTGTVRNQVRNLCVQYAQEGGYKKKEVYWNSFSDQVFAILRDTPLLMVSYDDMDTQTHLLGVPGGVIDLRYGKFIEANPALHMSKQTTVAPDFENPPTRFLKLLQEIAPDTDTQAWIDYVQSYLGYCITGETHIHACQFWHGGGTNGKSALWELVAEVLGDGYYGKGETKMLETRRGEAHSTELTVTRGRRMVVISEVDNKRMNVGMFKSLTGDSSISGRAMRENTTSWKRTSKLLLVGNKKPVLGNVDTALRRRIKLIPFEQCFEGREDMSLESDLRKEAGGVLAWLIEGAANYYLFGTLEDEPACVANATESYFDDEDVYKEWCEACIIKSEDGCTGAMLKQSYEDWCEANGVTPVWNKNEAFAYIETEYKRKKDKLNTGPYRNSHGFAGLGINNPRENEDLPSLD